MFKVYNSSTLTNKQRFTRAAIAGFAAMVIRFLVYCIIVSLLHVSSALLFLAMGYFIGWVIQYFGHGVQKKFSIMAVIYTVLAIVLSEAAAIYISVPFISILEIIPLVLAGYLDVSINNLIGLILRITGIMVAYQTSRIV